MKPREIREQEIKSNQQFTKPPPRQCSFSYRHILHRKQNDTVLRKLLASSTFAIAGALQTLINRLKLEADEKVSSLKDGESLIEELDQDFEALDELADEAEQTIADDVRANAVAKTQARNCPAIS